MKTSILCNPGSALAYYPMHETPLPGCISTASPSISGILLPRGSSVQCVQRNGFTLIELTAIIILVAILSFSAIPRFDALNGFDATAYRDQIKGTLQFARKSAVAQRRHVQVTTVNNAMTLTIASADPDGGFPVGLVTRKLALPGTGSNTILPPAKGTIATTAPTLIFDALGRPCDNGGAAFQAPTSFTISGFTLTVEAESGHVH